MHVSLHLHHLQGVISFYFDKVTNIIRVTNSVLQLQQLTSHNVLYIVFCHQLLRSHFNPLILLGL
jgi:hypothetical protein